MRTQLDVVHRLNHSVLPLVFSTEGVTLNKVIEGELQIASEKIGAKIPSGAMRHLTSLLSRFYVSPQSISDDNGIIDLREMDPSEVIIALERKLKTTPNTDYPIQLGSEILLTSGLFPDAIDAPSQGKLHSRDLYGVGSSAYGRAAHNSPPMRRELEDMAAYFTVAAAVLQQMRIKQEFDAMRTLGDAFAMVVRLETTQSPWYRSVAEEVMAQKGDKILAENGYLHRVIPQTHILSVLGTTSTKADMTPFGKAPKLKQVLH